MQGNCELQYEPLAFRSFIKVPFLFCSDDLYYPRFPTNHPPNLVHIAGRFERDEKGDIHYLSGAKLEMFHLDHIRDQVLAIEQALQQAHLVQSFRREAFTPDLTTEYY